MPAGVPPPEDLTSRKVSMFSLDTSVLEAASFRFREGSLFTLGAQLPPWMRLVMSEVVVHEMHAHRLANVERATEQIRSAIDDLGRYLGPERAPNLPPSLTELKRKAQHQFEDEFNHYLDRFNGLNRPGF